MSLFGLFNIGKSAMFASRAALSVVGHNIANVNTPGYNKQDIVLNTANPVDIGSGYLGTGVNIAAIRRNYDRFIMNQLIGQHQNTGRSYALNRSLSQIEQIFNEVKETGLASSITDYFKAWQEVSVNPDSRTHRIVLLNKANSLVHLAKRFENEISENLKNIDETIEDIVNRINKLASDIASLNKSIVYLEAGSEIKKANDLRDQRDNLLNELSSLAEVSSYEDKNGALVVVMGMKNLVNAENTNLLTTRLNEEGHRDIYLDGANITDRITKGQIGGFIDVRNDIESNILTKFRRLIASISKEVNLIHRTGYGLDASTGNDFFNHLQLTTKVLSLGANMTASIRDLSQLTLDEYEIRFDASNNYNVYNIQTGNIVASGSYISGDIISFEGIDVIITGTVSSSDRFIISPLKDAIRNFGLAISDIEKIAASSSDITLPGDNTNAIAISEIFEKSIENLGERTFMDYYRGLISDIGIMSRTASDSLRFDENMLREIQNWRESVSGVSLDEEAANLIRYQRSFEAAARMIRVTDELMEVILNL